MIEVLAVLAFSRQVYSRRASPFKSRGSGKKHFSTRSYSTCVELVATKQTLTVAWDKGHALQRNDKRNIFSDAFISISHAVDIKPLFGTGIFAVFWGIPLRNEKKSVCFWLPCDPIIQVINLLPLFSTLLTNFKLKSPPHTGVQLLLDPNAFCKPWDSISFPLCFPSPIHLALYLVLLRNTSATVL